MFHRPEGDADVKMKNVAALLVLAAIASRLCLLRAQAPAAESRTSWDGVYTEDQAKRGELIYGRECAACHGDMLAGRESAPPLTGSAFLAKTMPQGAPGRLTRQQDADILAFMLSVNKFPAGKTELYRQSEMLREIRFEATKPASKK